MALTDAIAIRDDASPGKKLPGKRSRTVKPHVAQTHSSSGCARATVHRNVSDGKPPRWLVLVAPAALSYFRSEPRERTRAVEPPHAADTLKRCEARGGGVHSSSARRRQAPKASARTIGMQLG